MARQANLDLDPWSHMLCEIRLWVYSLSTSFFFLMCRRGIINAVCLKGFWKVGKSKTHVTIPVQRCQLFFICIYYFRPSFLELYQLDIFPSNYILKKERKKEKLRNVFKWEIWQNLVRVFLAPISGLFCSVLEFWNGITNIKYYNIFYVL